MLCVKGFMWLRATLQSIGKGVSLGLSPGAVPKQVGILYRYRSLSLFTKSYATIMHLYKLNRICL